MSNPVAFLWQCPSLDLPKLIAEHGSVAGKVVDDESYRDRMQEIAEVAKAQGAAAVFAVRISRDEMIDRLRERRLPDNEHAWGLIAAEVGAPLVGPHRLVGLKLAAPPGRQALGWAVVDDLGSSDDRLTRLL